MLCVQTPAAPQSDPKGLLGKPSRVPKAHAKPPLSGSRPTAGSHDSVSFGRHGSRLLGAKQLGRLTYLEAVRLSLHPSRGPAADICRGTPLTWQPYPIRSTSKWREAPGTRPGACGDRPGSSGFPGARWMLRNGGAVCGSASLRSSVQSSAKVPSRSGLQTGVGGRRVGVPAEKPSDEAEMASAGRRSG